MSSLNHKEVVEKIITELKLLDGEFGVLPEEVRYKDFPFTNPIQPGILVSPLEEIEGNSTNQTSDIGYQVQIVRAYRKSSTGEDIQYDLGKRANWRQGVFNRFNCVRLGFPGVCELPVRVKFGNYEGKEAFDKINIDSSTVVVTVWIRQPLNG